MPRPEVRRLGGDGNPLYVVISNDHYWSGVAWTEHELAAKTYDNEQDATADCEKLVAPTIYRFVVPIKVTVEGDREFTPKELQKFLSEYVIAAVTHDPEYIGVEIQWDGLKEAAAKAKEGNHCVQRESD